MAAALPEWTDAHRRYLRFETAIGVVITVALSAGFAALVFGRSTPISAADPRLQIDSALQALIVAFMGSLVPTWVVHRRVRSGVLNPVPRPHRWPSGTFARSAAFAAVVGFPAAALHAIVMTRLPGLELGLAGLLAFKVGFGTAVALVATPLAIVTALKDN